MKKELLIPAGDMDCLKAAVHNGADAVYLGLKNFGARRFAHNFSKEDIYEAIKLCHLYGVKLYVTMNTLIKDSEVEEFLENVAYLYKIGVDALIMQDFGMICYVREKYPELEIHVSTQFNNSTEETLRFLEELGVKRVVFARELSLNRICEMKTSLEKEVFIHGALCISYSGNCLMSSMQGGRSGNRGECTGSCRLPFDLYQEEMVVQSNQYLLSTKELNSTPTIEALLKSDVLSFKVEGRMKSTAYVSFITRFYRSLIDGKKLDFNQEQDSLRILFNREFTTGHLFNDSKIMNIQAPNHLGLDIGKVLEVNKNKISIKLDKELVQEDSIRFKESNKGCTVNFLYDKRDNLIHSAKAGDVVFIDNKIDLTTLDTVSKTKDKKLNETLLNYSFKKIPISIELNAYYGKELGLIVRDEKHCVKQYGSLVEEAKNAPISKERIVIQLQKLGNSSFVSDNISVSMDESIFISIKDLNELRRNAVETLQSLREESKPEMVIKKVVFPKLAIPRIVETSALVRTEEQMLACREVNIKNIYTDQQSLLIKYPDKVLLRKTRNKEQILSDSMLVSEYVPFSRYSNLRGTSALNVFNIYTVYYLLKYGLEVVPLSVELSDLEKISLIKKFKDTFGFMPNVEIFAYGRVENMVIKGNILNITKKLNCYQLKNHKGNFFFVYYDGQNTYVLNSDITSIPESIFGSEQSLFFDFYNESGSEVIKIVKQIINDK